MSVRHWSNRLRCLTSLYSLSLAANLGVGTFYSFTLASKLCILAGKVGLSLLDVTEEFEGLVHYLFMPWLYMNQMLTALSHWHYNIITPLKPVELFLIHSHGGGESEALLITSAKWLGLPFNEGTCFFYTNETKLTLTWTSGLEKRGEICWEMEVDWKMTP